MHVCAENNSLFQLSTVMSTKPVQGIWLYLFLHLKNILGEVSIIFVFWKSTAEYYFQNLKKKLLQEKITMQNKTTI